MLALVGILVSAVQSERPPYQTHRAELRDTSAEQLLAACLRIDSDEGAPSERACEEAGNQADLRAQQHMARFAELQFWLNVFSAALLAGTVLFAYRAWREAARSADVAERGLAEADRGRAHVQIDADAIMIFRPSRLAVHAGRMLVTTPFVVKNIGTRFIVLRTMRIEYVPRGADIFDASEPKPPVDFSAIRAGVPSIFSPVLLPPNETVAIDGRSGKPLPEEYERDGFYILGRVHYTDHLETMREAGFCFQWATWLDDDYTEEGFTMYRWSYDRRIDQGGS